MKRLLLATTAFAAVAIASQAVSSQALAADLGTRAPIYSKAPAYVPVSNWSGLYIGGNVGYGWGNNTAHIDFGDPFLIDQNLSVNSNGVIGGGQLGYNFQTGSTVFGFEADIQGSGISGSASVAPLPGASTSASGDPSFASTDEKITWFGTVRARLGFAITPDLLLYGTGGAAYGGVKITPDGVQESILRRHLSGPLDKTKGGWTAGAGAEWMFARNWSAKVEYLYIDLGNATTFAGLGGLQLRSVGADYTSSFKENTVRFGVNYHFN